MSAWKYVFLRKMYPVPYEYDILGLGKTVKVPTYKLVNFKNVICDRRLK